MITFVDQLAAKPVLTSENILSIKKYIEYKYPHRDAKGKAQILAQSIHQVIDRELKDFDIHQQEELRKRLLQKALFEQQRSIFCSDILECCMTMDNFTDDTLHTLNNWVNHKINDSVQMDTIVNYRQSLLSPHEKLIIKDIEEDPLLVPPMAPTRPMVDTVSVSPVILEVPPIKEKTVTMLDRLSKYYLSVMIFMAFILLFIGYSFNTGRSIPVETTVHFNFEQPVQEASFHSFTDILDGIIKLYHIPMELRYEEINTSSLQDYLINRGSLLGKEPYFSIIMETSQAFHLNPLVLFSIAGHEQGFVPENHPNAQEIINNPYNVFVSWMDYNTDLEDSSAIAARTVSNLLRGLPNEMDPFQWVNRRYAEDPSWWKGVRAIYSQLNKVVNSH